MTAPSLHQQMLTYIADLQKQAAATHERHMAEWERFKKPEYQDDLRNEILAQTHEDTPPPWLTEEELD